MPSVDAARLQNLVRRAKELAFDYRELTGRPLGITGEVGECEAVRLLDLDLSDVRKAGCDAVEKSEMRTTFQIKTRCLRKGKGYGRTPKFSFKYTWEAALLVLLDENFETTGIYRAEREDVQRELQIEGSVARNIRGTLSVSKFKQIGKLVWPPPNDTALNV